MSTELTTKAENRELTTAHAAASARSEIESAITVAMRFPRDEDGAYAALMKSCKRPSFAEKARYKFPRGGQDVSGPSAHLARESARVWGNIRYGFEIIRDDEETIHVRGYAWDVQTNARATQDAHFKKRVQRRNKVTRQTEWVIPDERDLRELVNKHGAIAERNCILKLIPSDYIEDAMLEAAKSMEGNIANDLDAQRKKTISAFATLNITPADLEKYLGAELRHATPAQIADLRAVWKSIQDGHSRWSDYVAPAPPKPTKTLDEALKATGKATPAKQPEPVHGDAWEPDEEERASIDGQLFATHPDAAEE